MLRNVTEFGFITIFGVRILSILKKVILGIILHFL